MRKILVANRGEIAVRICRACRDAGYHSVAIASEPDRNGLPARSADECHVLKGTSPRETYLNQAAILDIAARSGADAIHPGYGLLSENETFAAAVEAAGLTWIGPPAHAIALLGSKVGARSIAETVGAPLLPASEVARLTLDVLRGFAAAHGLPVIIKAQNGGGGRGMRVVREIEALRPMLEAAEREAMIAFGRSECFVERYVERARHVETQCLADAHGNVAILSTRDCTLQRRHQKIVEEAPAPFLRPEQQELLEGSSRDILKAARYRGAATCEFLVSSEGDVYFLEVNTRIQVEHPVTEEVTGIDVIGEMFRIAEGGRLDVGRPGVRGHAIEFRINAEDPWSGFQPTPGRIDRLRLPGGPGVRTDFGYEEGDAVPPYYDSLVGKLIVTGATRTESFARARRALKELAVEGIKTIAPLHRAILECPEFVATERKSFAVHTRWVDDELERLSAAALRFCETAKRGSPPPARGQADAKAPLASETDPSYRIGIKAPLSGLVLQILVNEGDQVSIGDAVAVMESMKMEQTILAETAGVVVRINVVSNAFIEMDADLLGLD